MSTTIRIDSFADNNIVERGVLKGAVEVASTKLELVSTDGFEAGQTIYIGTLASEGVEKAVIGAVVDESELTLNSPLKMAHASSSAVTAVLGDRIKIYRAPNVDGSVPDGASFSVLVTRSVDADQPSTYYRDQDGSSSYWYSYAYYNVDTDDETDRSEPFRGDDFEHYASLGVIRKESGFSSAHNLADSYVDEARRQAQSEINTACANRFTVPFDPVPEQIRTLTIRLAAATLRYNAFGDGASEKALSALRGELKAIASGEVAIVGDDGVDLSSDEGVSGYFGDSPRMFSVEQKF